MIRPLLISLLCLSLSACDTSAPHDPENTAEGSNAALCPEGSECDLDAGRSENPGHSGVDSESAAPEGEGEPREQGPLFELGTNITGANTPDSFSPLVDGDELNVELGFQGLWMVVLAFRTRDIFTGKLTIITRIEVEGEHQGELGLAKQKLIPSGGSLDYYYNLFLVVLDPSVGGQTGLINIRVSDDHGALVNETLEVQLTGGSSD